MKYVIHKQTKNNGLLTFMEVDRDVAREMIEKNHYSKKWNTSFGIVNIGVFRDDVLLGVAVFGNLMNPGSYKSISDELESNNIIELNRLWIDDSIGHNGETTMLGASFKIIRKCYPHIKAIQSFADGRLGCGTIYKASNFDYYGFDQTLFAENTETGEVFHHVPFENTKRPGSMLERWRMLLDDKCKWFDVKTYRYIYWLDRKVKCKKEKLPYPEYSKGIDYREFTYPPRMYARAYLMFKWRGEDNYANLAKAKSKSLDFDAEIKDLEENETMKWLKTLDEFNRDKGLTDLFGHF